MTQKKDRRQFLKTSALGIAAAGLWPKTPLKAEENKPAPLNKGLIKRYNTLGRTGFKISDIGIGSSRVFSAEIFRALLDAGVNYIDTAEGYGQGGSERSIGEAIQGRDRGGIFITSKLRLQGNEDKQRILDKTQACLERLQTDYLDCLMIHGPQTTADLINPAFHAACEQLKKEKKIRHVGVSNHGPRQPGAGDSMEDVLLAAAKDGRFDVLLLIYNFIQHEPGDRILEACTRHNLGATIMKSDPLGRYHETRERVAALKAEGREIEPRLLQSLEQLEETAAKGQEFLKKHNLHSALQIKQAAIRFILGDPRAHTVNLAFSTFEDIDTYLSLSGTSLDGKEEQALAAWRRESSSLYCRHACGLCERACPHQVPVNTIMRYSHYFELNGSEKHAMAKYASIPGEKAALCAACSGVCQNSCPHGVPIHGMLALAHRQLSLA